MGNCIYCGEKAGWFKSKHPDCATKHNNGVNRIVELIASAGIRSETDLNLVENDIKGIAESSFIDSPRQYIVRGFEQSVNLALDDDLLSEDEEKKLLALINHFDFEQEELDVNGYYSKLTQAAVLRDIMEGKIPERVKFDLALPFNLMKSEKLVWVFTDVDYYEQKTRTKYVGGSQGFSVRVAKGLYYRAGAFKGNRIQYDETVHAGTGLLGITDKHIYFSGGSKNFRIRYNKIVSFEPYEDGLGVQRDAMTAKPQIFKTGDGWFIHNIVTNLAQL